MDKEIEDLLAKTAQTRYQFLCAELQTCWTALELGRYQLSVGNIETARKEAAVVETGVRTLERFLSQVSLDQWNELRPKVMELKTSLDLFKAQLP